MPSQQLEGAIGLKEKWREGEEDGGTMSRFLSITQRTDPYRLPLSPHSTLNTRNSVFAFFEDLLELFDFKLQKRHRPSFVSSVPTPSTLNQGPQIYSTTIKASDMAKIKKKGESGAATNFISRNQALKKLQITLADFR
jgi:hypothetical protein